ncbi:MAG: MBL fold metallo-hydrolase [Verrucomicrobiota bacterium]
MPAITMTNIPLEDNFSDIIGKAQRGLKLSDDQLVSRSAVSLEELERIKSGQADEPVLGRIAQSLNLGKTALIESAKKLWYPHPQELGGLAQFNTPYGDMTVNAYLIWDPETKHAAVLDTGATSSGILQFIKAEQLTIKFIFLTHTHPDHIADLTRLKMETGVPVFVNQLEAVDGAETFSEGHEFNVGKLHIDTRQTSGHSRGGITYVISGLARKVALTGDSIFAGSMGGGAVSYPDALNNNRKKVLTLEDDTILCPGHGPLTTVGEEKMHNPFFPEFQHS